MKKMTESAKYSMIAQVDRGLQEWSIGYHDGSLETLESIMGNLRMAVATLAVVVADNVDIETRNLIANEVPGAGCLYVTEEVGDAVQ